MHTACPESITSVHALGVGEEVIPERYELLGSYPNPTNVGAYISYALPDEVRVRLEVYNVLGQLVRILVEGIEGPGYMRVYWDGRDEGGNQVSSGVYIYRLEAGKFRAAGKMVILR